MTAKSILALAVACVCIEAQAVGTWTNGQQLLDGILWKPGFHGFYVKAGTYDNPGSCSNSTSNLYLIDATTEQDGPTANRLFAMISMAMAQGKKVFVWVDGCQNGHPNFTGLQIVD